MTAAFDALPARRARLLAHIERQRREFGTATQVLRPPLAMLDLAISVLRFSRRHPLTIVGGIALLRLLAPLPVRRVLNWWQRGHQLLAVLKPRR